MARLRARRRQRCVNRAGKSVEQQSRSQRQPSRTKISATTTEATAANVTEKSEFGKGEQQASSKAATARAEHRKQQ
eukprot:4111015-Pleurochrysis_carterae.AAC.1